MLWAINSKININFHFFAVIPCLMFEKILMTRKGIGENEERESVGASIKRISRVLVKTSCTF